MTQKLVQSMIAGLPEALAQLRIPAGIVVFAPTLTAPVGTLPLMGSSGLGRQAHSDLFAFAQASGLMAASEAAREFWQFGPGDGTTTFSLPDYRGEFFRVLDQGRGVDPGRGLGTWQIFQNQSHDHAVSYVQWGSHGPSGAGNYGAGTYGRQGTVTAASGGAEARPRNIALPAYIFY